MLILDPTSIIAELRSKETVNNYSNYIGSLNNFKTEFECWDKKFPGFQHCIYNDLLGSPCYIVTKHDQKTNNDIPIHAYSSMYLTKPTLNSPHFYWIDGPVCHALFEYVKEKWDNHARSNTEGSVTNLASAKGSFNNQPIIPPQNIVTVRYKQH
jgi:hypothetical protein